MSHATRQTQKVINLDEKIPWKGRAVESITKPAWGGIFKSEASTPISPETERSVPSAHTSETPHYEPPPVESCAPRDEPPATHSVTTTATTEPATTTTAAQQPAPEPVTTAPSGGTASAAATAVTDASSAASEKIVVEPTPPTAPSPQPDGFTAFDEEFFNSYDDAPQPIARTLVAALLFACAVAVASIAFEMHDREAHYASYRTEHHMLVRVPTPPVVAPTPQPSPTRRPPRPVTRRPPAPRRPPTPSFVWDRRLDATTPGLGASARERIPALCPPSR